MLNSRPLGHSTLCPRSPTRTCANSAALRSGLNALSLGIGPHIGFGGDVAQRIIAHRLGGIAGACRLAGAADGVFGQPVQAVVAEMLRIALVGIGAARETADGNT